MKRSVLLLALFLIPASAHADPAPAAQPPIADLIAQAKKEGKPLIIDFYAVWCRPCKKFKKEVLPKPEVQKALASVIFHQYDAEKGNGKKAAKRYAVRGFPTFAVIDGNGKLRTRRMGFQTVDRFVALVDRAQVDVLDKAGVQQLLARKGKDPRTLLAVARWYRGQGDWKQADALYQRAVKADPGNAQGIAGKAAWECLQLQRYHKARAWVVRTNAGFIRRFPSAPVALTAFERIATALPQAERDKLAAAMLPGMKDDATRLNSAVYVFLAVGTLDAALAAAKRQVELAPNKANPYDSLAEAHHYRGEQQAAVAAAKKAIALAANKPAQLPTLRANLKRFSAPGKRVSFDVERAKYRAKSFLARLPGTDPVAQKLTNAPRRRSNAATSARMAAYRSFRIARNKAYRNAADACITSASGYDELYIRVEFAAPEKTRAKKVVVLEPGAPRRLKRCLVRSLKKAEFGKRPKRYNERYTGILHFPKGSARLDAIMKAKKPGKKRRRRRR
jgi:thioredoxin-related protein/Tfp pilus assembly protein PilF